MLRTRPIAVRTVETITLTLGLLASVTTGASASPTSRVPNHVIGFSSTVTLNGQTVPPDSEVNRWYFRLTAATDSPHRTPHGTSLTEMEAAVSRSAMVQTSWRHGGSSSALTFNLSSQATSRRMPIFSAADPRSQTTDSTL